MKKLILTTIMSAATVAAFAQGTVNFSNLSTALSSPPDRLIRFGSHDGTQPVTAGQGAGTNAYPGLVAQLYYGASTASEASLIPVTSGPATLRSSTSANIGTWFNGTRTVTGFNAGETISLQVRVWDISKGTDFTVATAPGNRTQYAGATGNWFGQGGVFLYSLTTNPTPAPSDFNMFNFTGFTLQFVPVPEPSMFALAGLGAAALVIFRRRK
jgi:hypothetical protein